MPKSSHGRNCHSCGPDHFTPQGFPGRNQHWNPPLTNSVVVSLFLTKVLLFQKRTNEQSKYIIGATNRSRQMQPSGGKETSSQGELRQVFLITRDGSAVTSSQVISSIATIQSSAILEPFCGRRENRSEFDSLPAYTQHPDLHRPLILPET